MDIVVLSLILTINMLPDHKQEKRNYTPDNNNHVINNKGDVREGVVRLQRTTVFFLPQKTSFLLFLVAREATSSVSRAGWSPKLASVTGNFNYVICKPPSFVHPLYLLIVFCYYLASP